MLRLLHAVTLSVKVIIARLRNGNSDAVINQVCLMAALFRESIAVFSQVHY